MEPKLSVVNTLMIYSAIRDAVKYYPNFSDYKTPVAFVVVDDLSELDGANAGQGLKDKSLFYFKKWEKTGRNLSQLAAGFPIVAIEYEDINYGDLFKKNYLNYCYNFRLGVLDLLDRPCQDGGKPLQRTKQQLYADTETVLVNILEFLSCTVLTNEDPRRLVHQDYAILKGIDYDVNLSKKLWQKSQPKNANPTGFLWNSHNRYGTFIRFQVCKDHCAPIAWNFELDEKKFEFKDCCP